MTQKIVTFGEIMLRLATPGHQRFSQASSYCASFGGGEANVAVSLANFGLKAEYVTRLPDNDIGRSVIMELKKHSVGTENVIFGGERLGIYFLETGSVSRPGKVVYDRSHSSASEIKPGMIDWDKVFTGATWFHWTGITPAISQGAADTCMEAIRAAKKSGLTVSCDLNYRKNLWKWGSSAKQVMPEMVGECEMKKMPRKCSISNPIRQM
jgi:2-dehydro-3-deoxygluconokinase